MTRVSRIALSLEVEESAWLRERETMPKVVTVSLSTKALGSYPQYRLHSRVADAQLK